MGTWAVPFTTKQATVLQTILATHVSANNAVDIFYNHVGDDDLFDRIDEILEKDGAVSDVRPAVMCTLQDWFGATGDDKAVRDSWHFKDPFEQGALDIFKSMLTDWNEKNQYPS